MFDAFLEHICVYKVNLKTCVEQVTDIEGKGRGVVATKPFGRGDFVVEYAGDLIDLSLAKTREDKYSEDLDIGCYMYYFTHNDRRYW